MTTRFGRSGESVSGCPVTRDVLIEQLAEEFLQGWRRGERPDAEEYARRYPELAAQIAELFPALVMLEECAPTGVAAKPERPPLPDEVPSRLGDYGIIREIGRGGMGVVYEAEHNTLRRRVALKLLPRSAAARSSGLQRFLSEARAAGRLHHTNIVPIFEVGEQDGQYFYAMQYIHGQNLDAVIDELRRWNAALTGEVPWQAAGGLDPVSALSRTLACELLTGASSPALQTQEDLPRDATEPGCGAAGANCGHAPPSPETGGESSEFSQVGGIRDGFFQRVARIGLQVAEALDYAHRHGILHRDIKPANLILDTTGTVWVTDFGLAKHEEDDFTRSGDIVGTLRYLAPERLQGQADARSDVYSLGLTLYELSMLRPAHNASDRFELLRQIEQTPPPAPRQLVPHFPRDLETILLKAIDKSPAHRYPSAAAMAEDLRLFLADRPILARRAWWSERLWRWCRRNPVSAGLAACVAVLLLALVAGSLAVAVITSHQAQELTDQKWRAEIAEQEAVQAKEQAVRRLYEAYLHEAQARRWSSRAGQHAAALAALGRAAEILPTLRLDAAEETLQRLALRNEAVAALPLIDLQEIRRWQPLGGMTTAVAFSPDYGLLAQSDGDGDVRLSRVEDGAPVRRLEGPGQRAWLLTFSPDGKYLAGKFHRGAPSPTTPMIRVWDLSTGRLVLAQDSGLGLGRMAFCGDGSQFALGVEPGELRLYDLPAGNLSATYKLRGQPLDLCAEPAGSRLAIAFPGRGPVEIWDLAGQQQATIDAGGDVTSLAWSPDGSTLALGTFEGEILLQRLDEPDQQPRKLEGHQASVVRLVFNHGGDLLASHAWDTSTRLWQLAGGSQVLRLEPPLLPGTGFSQDDRQLAFVLDGLAFGIWSVAPGEGLRLLPGGEDLGARYGVTFHPRRPDLLASPTKSGLELWNAATGKLLQRLDCGETLSAAFVPGGESLLTSGRQGVRRWKLNDPSDAHPPVDASISALLLPGRSERISLDAIGRRVAIDRGFSTAAVLTLEPPQRPRTIEPHSQLDHVALSPDGRWLITTTWKGGGVILWDVDQGGSRDLAADVGSATPAFSPDGRWLAVSDGYHYHLWEVGSWRRIHRIPREHPDGWPGPVAFSPEGHILAVPHTRNVAQLIDPRSGESLAVLEPPDSTSLCGYSFSCDGRYFAAAGPRDIQVWDLSHIRSRLTALEIDWKDRHRWPLP